MVGHKQSIQYEDHLLDAAVYCLGRNLEVDWKKLREERFVTQNRFVVNCLRCKQKLYSNY